MGLKDPDIAKMQGTKDVKGLIKALKHNQTFIRERAAKALGDLKDDKAITALINALKDKNKDVQLNVEEALKNYDPEKVNRALSVAEEMHRNERKHASERALRIHFLLFLFYFVMSLPVFYFRLLRHSDDVLSLILIPVVIIGSALWVLFDSENLGIENYKKSLLLLSSTPIGAAFLVFIA